MRPFPKIPLLSVIFLVLPLLAAPPAAAEDDAIAPVEKYSQQIDQLKGSVTDLGKKIDDAAKQIDAATDAKAAKAQIEDIKAAVGKLLADVADNGQVAQMGRHAQQRVDEKLKALQTDTRFTPDERKFLVEQWRKLQAETQEAGKNLDAARSEFAGLLGTLQHNEDFIDELVQIRQASKAVDVLRDLTARIRESSGRLKALLTEIKVPAT